MARQKCKCYSIDKFLKGFRTQKVMHDVFLDGDGMSVQINKSYYLCRRDEGDWYIDCLIANGDKFSSERMTITHCPFCGRHFKTYINGQAEWRTYCENQTK